jgi:hypothetical protein
MNKSYLSLLLGTCFLSPLSASAQLSQLDFDFKPNKKIASVVVDSKENRELIKEMTGETTVEVDGVTKTLPADKEDSLAALSGEKVEESVSQQPVWLVPAKSGPKVDSDNAATITSFVGWESEEGESCSKPVNEVQSTMKSRALENVISRLTGEKPSSFCSNTCETGKQPLVSKLTIADMKGGAFKFSVLEGSCTYQMTSPEEGWTKLQVEKITCECM